MTSLTGRLDVTLHLISSAIDAVARSSSKHAPITKMLFVEEEIALQSFGDIVVRDNKDTDHFFTR